LSVVVNHYCVNALWKNIKARTSLACNFSPVVRKNLVDITPQSFQGGIHDAIRSELLAFRSQSLPVSNVDLSLRSGNSMIRSGIPGPRLRCGWR
jgi:hypothetical protein